MTEATSTAHDRRETTAEVLDRHLAEGRLPGAVALVARGDDVAVHTVGSLDTGGTAPMERDTLFRVASLTKPVVAAAVMMLVEDGTLAPESPVEEWLPELASPSVVRTPGGPVDDVVPAARPITVLDLLTFRAGWGFPSDFSLPAVRPLFEVLKQGPTRAGVPEPDTWTAALAGIPLLAQPGEAYLYNTCSDIQGVLIARASGRSLPDFLAERVFAPLAMADTGFQVPAAARDRLATAYRPAPAGGLEFVDGPDGEWTAPPAFPSGAGGLVSTADDLFAFARMMLRGGTGPAGRALLSPDSVRQMTANHLTLRQMHAATLFLEGQGWGYGGSVDVAPTQPWHVPGRYGWVGGTGTAAHLVPATGTVTVLLTQVEMTSPTPAPLTRDFWRSTAGV